MAKKLAPIPPGEVLFDEFMKPFGVSRNRLARDVDIPVGRVSDIVRGKRSITPDSALRLAEYLGTSSELWLNLQADFDLRCARSVMAGHSAAKRSLKAT